MGASYVKKITTISEAPIARFNERAKTIFRKIDVLAPSHGVLRGLQCGWKHKKDQRDARRQR
jgi:hypothetical protein